MRISFNNTHVPRSVPRQHHTALFGALQKNIVPTFSGKSALALLLRYHRLSGALEHKAAEVLVPPWMGYWVYMIMHKYCFPTTTFNSRVRGLMLYHQWGFPQRIESVLPFAKKKGLFVIEDCAHAFEGMYGDKRLGTFGDAAIFSLAKYFPCVVGGAVYSSNLAIRTFASDSVPKRPTPFEREVFAQRARYDRNPSAKEARMLEQNYAVYDTLLTCNPKALEISSDRCSRGAIDKRKANARFLQQNFDPRDRFGLYHDDIAPWIVPLFFSKSQSQRVVRALQGAGVEAGELRFDVNRNMLNPDYRACVAVPCHDGITASQLEKIVRIICDARN